MAEAKQHTLSKFYLSLKLGIWTSGEVEGWGLVQNMDVCANGSTNKGCFVKKQPEEYKRGHTITKKQLSIGLNLLDIYLLEIEGSGRSKTYNYIAVISECRLKGAFEERIYFLKVTNYKTMSEFTTIILNSTSAVVYKTKHFSLNPKRRVSRFDNSPINSATRKH